MVPRYLLWLKVRVEKGLLMKFKPNCLNYAAAGQSPDLIILCIYPDLQTQTRNEILKLQVDPPIHSSLAPTWEQNEWSGYYSMLRTKVKVAWQLIHYIILLGQMWENITVLDILLQKNRTTNFSPFHTLFCWKQFQSSDKETSQ